MAYPETVVAQRKAGAVIWIVSALGLTAIILALIWKVAVVQDPGLIVRSEPAGASVFVSNRLMGETPLTVTGFSSQTLDIRLVLQGYEDTDALVDSPRKGGFLAFGTGGKPRELLFEMMPVAESRLVITTYPTGSEISLDGRRMGRTPLTLDELRPGPRRIDAVYTGFKPLSKDIQLQPGAEMQVHLELEDMVSPLYESMIRAEPANMNHYSELAHHYVLLGKFKEAGDALRAAKEHYGQADEKSLQTFFGTIRKIYRREFIYPQETEDNKIRPICREIVETAIKESIGSERGARSALKGMNDYDERNKPK